MKRRWQSRVLAFSLSVAMMLSVTSTAFAVGEGALVEGLDSSSEAVVSDESSGGVTGSAAGESGSGIVDGMGGVSDADSAERVDEVPFASDSVSSEAVTAEAPDAVDVTSGADAAGEAPDAGDVTGGGYDAAGEEPGAAPDAGDVAGGGYDVAGEEPGEAPGAGDVIDSADVDAGKAPGVSDVAGGDIAVAGGVPAGSGGVITGDVAGSGGFDVMLFAADPTEGVMGEDGIYRVTPEDGITYRFKLNDEGYTAELTDMDDPEMPSEAAVPDSVIYEGQSYTVTGLNWAYPFDASKRRANITALTLPETLQTVNTVSFLKFPSLTEITIPGSVETFAGTFQNMDCLTAVTFADGMKTIQGNMIFSGCIALETVNLPSSLETIGESTFSSAPIRKIALPASLTTIENQAFSGCQIEEIVLPGSLQELGARAFSDCTNLAEVSLPAGITEIGDSLFYGCTSLTKVEAASTIASVGENAFYGCIKLETIPSLRDATSMGPYAFYNCQGLNGELDISSLTEIPDYAFFTTGFDSVLFSDQLISIGKAAFQACHIKTVTFPDTLQTIGISAFENSYVGFDGETVVIPDSVTTVQTRAFYNARVRKFQVGKGVTMLYSKAFTNGLLSEITFANPANEITNYYFILSEAKGATVKFGEPLPVIVNLTQLLQNRINGKSQAEDNNESILLEDSGGHLVVTIREDVSLDSTILIPTGTNVTIRSSAAATGDSPFMIQGEGGKNIGTLFKVEEGAEAEFENVKLFGAFNSGGVLDVKGAATLKTGATVSDSVITGNSSGAIRVHGPNASFTLDGGEVRNNTIKASCSAPVLVSGGASVSVTSGTISGNTVEGGEAGATSSAGILVYKDGAGTMTGGAITNNTACRGSAVMLYSNDAAQKALFTLSGGSITGNTGGTGAEQGSGAVHIEGNAAFTMEGGSISNNTGYNGAGVCVVDRGIQTGEPEYGTAFIMNGGTISNNRGTVGGGIYSYSNGVKLNAGSITNNRASLIGGGVYSEGNSEYYSTLHLQSAWITANEAEQGGGLWFCPTGNAELYITNGCAVYDNTATGAGADLVSANKEAYFVTLANRILGGGRVLWYDDGAISTPLGTNTRTDVIPGCVRYDAGNPGPALKILDSLQRDLSLKAVVNADAAAYAAGQAALLIQGNSAQLGGGIGANGGIVIGDSGETLIDIPVTKVWNHGSNPEENRPGPVTVKLFHEDIEMDSLVLTEANNWQGVFEDLLPGLDYELRETAVENYTAEIVWTSGADPARGVTVTNAYSPETGSLAITKTVEGTTTLEEFRFAVTLNNKAISGLYGDLEFVDGVAEFTLTDGETKVAAGLPEGVKFVVTEEAVENYTSTASNSEGVIRSGITAKAEFINTYAPASVPTPTPPPEEPPVPTPPPEQPPAPTPPPEDPFNPLIPLIPLIPFIPSLFPTPVTPSVVIPAPPVPLEGVAIVEEAPPATVIESEPVPTAAILPQTGQLNWPVPVLLLSGTAMIGIGLYLRYRRKKNEHEA